MESPFAMNFEVIKQQAEENLKADKGQNVTPQTGVQPTGAQPAAGGKPSFLDMVDAAEKKLKEEEPQNADQPATAPQADGQPSFDDMFSQAAPAQAAPAQAAPAQAAPAQAAPALSFDDMIAQAENNPVQTAEFEEMFVQNGNGVQPAAAAQPSASFMNAPAQDQAAGQAQNQGDVAPFDAMFQQAKGAPAAAPAEAAKSAVPEGVSPFDAFAPSTPKVENPAQEVPKAEEIPVQEVPAQDAPKAEEEPKAEETPAQEMPKAEETPAQEMPKAEEAAKKSKRSNSKSKKQEEAEPKEPLPDKTGDYKVDILGEAKEEPKTEEPKAAHASEEGDKPLSMDNLFSAEEIAKFRADIRTFVRKEFKMAMVGAVKDLLTEFGE